MIADLLNQYGYIVLYAALALELIAFPTPGETLMTYCGFLTSQGQLNWIISIATASLGIRHVTGYFSGITRIPYKRFAINAYIGAVIWSGTFISLGRVLGDNWEKYHGPIKKYLIILGLIIGLVLAAIYLFKSFKAQIQNTISRAAANSLHVYHSAGKIKLVLVGFSTAAITLAFFAGGLIQGLSGQ